MISPFVYTPEESLKVLDKTMAYLKANGLEQEVSNLGWVFYSLHEALPETTEQVFSGHFFPIIESWDELQVSFNLCLFGFYKQAMCSLRSGLETGLLSVYWNLSDDAHLVIRDWLRAKEDTPRLTDIWKRLETNENIRRFQAIHDIKGRLLGLRYLHDYVHTKGAPFSNSIGVLKPNFQSFAEKGVQEWLKGFREVVIVVTVLHILKNPVAVIRYDYSKKFGIDKPSFGGLEAHQVTGIKELIGAEYFSTVEAVAQKDMHVAKLMAWITNLPDVTEEYVEEQIINIEKISIEGMGFLAWVANTEKFIGSEWHTERVQKRVAKLQRWAEDNGYLEPKFKIPHHLQ